MTGMELGHALITLMEPDRETVEEYNRWYERDHFLTGVLAGPGAFAGARFVATRDLKRRRHPAESPVAQPVDDGSFLTLYWIEQDRLSAHTDWGFPEAARMAAAGRMDTRRHHVSTAYYDLVGVTARDADPVPAELALHHRYDGLIAVWADEGVAVADQLVGGPVSQVVSFKPISLPDPLPAMPGAVMGDPDRRVQVHIGFVDDLSAGWPDTSDLDVLLAAPFVPTVPGTSTHLDDLW